MCPGSGELGHNSTGKCWNLAGQDLGIFNSSHLFHKLRTIIAEHFPLNILPVVSVSDFLVLLGVLSGVELMTGVDSAVCIAPG